MIVEFDGFDDLTFNYEGRYARAETPEKLQFAQRALSQARLELEATRQAFDDDTVEAVRSALVELGINTAGAAGSTTR